MYLNEDCIEILKSMPMPNVIKTWTSDKLKEYFAMCQDEFEESYTLTKSDKGWGCSCPAGIYRNKCWHLSEIKNIKMEDEQS